MLARLEERLDLHAAVDRGELFARGHAGRDHQIGHGVGHADDGVASLRGPAFAGLKEQPRPPALVRMERRAVDRVDHGRHAQRPGGGAAEHSALGAVRMNHVGPKSPQRPFELPIADGVAPRMDRPAQRGDDFQRHPPCPGPIQQTPFRPQRRPGDQQHVVAVLAEQVFAAEHGVFLCSAEDQSRDDVGDTHGLASTLPSRGLFGSVHRPETDGTQDVQRQ